jgi:hypothetical protein
MRRGLIVLLVLLVAVQPALLRAQQATVPASSNAAPGAPDNPIVTFEKLGVSLERIKRELGGRPPTRDGTGLKLDFYVEVVGQAPPIQLFTPQELAAGPVPFAPPTHADILNMITKPEFRSPAVPISTLAIMGIQKLVEWQIERAKRQKAEEERRKREEERKRFLEQTRIVIQPPK